MRLLERIESHALSGLQWLARRSQPQQSGPSHLATGVDGERVALFYLLRKGYKVVAERWSSGDLPGDIDLIVWRQGVLCMVEVKTRTVRDEAPAEIAVDWKKRNTLRRLARRYLRELPGTTPPQVRFDVLSVYLQPGKEAEFEQYENAFGWNEHERDEWH